MPIKGLTERRRLPRSGKIHLGIKATTAKGVEHPKAVDYFVLPQEHALYKQLVELFGEKPKELRIMFPVEDEDKVASQYYRAYSRTRGLICKGDGETCRRLVDTQTGDLATHEANTVEWRQMSCQGRECPDYQAKRCKEIMNLQFMLPEVDGLGVWQIDTSSINSIQNVNSNLAMLKAVYQRISLIPLILELGHKEVTPEGGKKKTVWVMNLRSPDNLIDAAKLAMRKPLELIAAMGEVETPVPDDEMPDLLYPEGNGDSDNEEPGAGEAGWDELSNMQDEATTAVIVPPTKPEVITGTPPDTKPATSATVTDKLASQRDELLQFVADKLHAKGTTGIRTVLVNRFSVDDKWFNTVEGIAEIWAHLKVHKPEWFR